MDDGIDPDPFEAVTAETRVAILRALAERVAAEPSDPALSFSDLRRETGLRDSGNFNYHLDELRPEFVRSTDEGYVLTPAGVELVGTLRAGVAPADDRGPVALDHDCGLCGAALSATYEDGLLAVTCDEGHALPRGTLPPAAVADRDLADAAELLVVRTVEMLAYVRRGVCPTCYGEMAVAQVSVEEAPQPADLGFRGTCDDCGMVYAGPTGSFLLDLPAVVSFCADHDLDPTGEGYWALDLPVRGGEVVDREPLRLAVSQTLDDERLRVVVDESLSVVESEREPVEG
jgi:hypothetical protein